MDTGPIRNNGLGLKGTGGLKGDICKLWAKNHHILFYMHDIKRAMVLNKSIDGKLT